MRYCLNMIFIGLLVGGAIPTKGDSIQITNLHFEHKSGGKTTAYTVAIRYFLDSHARGTIRVGFNIKSPRVYEIVAKKDVPQGDGAFEITANVEDADHSVMNAHVDLSDIEVPKKEALQSHMPWATATRIVQIKDFNVGMLSSASIETLNESRNKTNDVVSVSNISFGRLPDSKFWTYRVTARYRLGSVENANLSFGFDIDTPGIYVLLENKWVDKGEGVAEVLIDFPKPITVVYLILTDEQKGKESKQLAFSKHRILSPKTVTKPTDVNSPIPTHPHKAIPAESVVNHLP